MLHCRSLKSTIAILGNQLQLVMSRLLNVFCTVVAYLVTKKLMLTILH